MYVAYWNLHWVPILASLVLLNHLEISGHMIQYDRQSKPIHLPKIHNAQRLQKNNRPNPTKTTTTTEEPVEYEPEEGISTTSRYDYPTNRLGYGYNAYNSYDYHFSDPTGYGGSYDYGYGTTVEMEEHFSTTKTPPRSVKETRFPLRKAARKDAQRMVQSGQGVESIQTSAKNGNGGSKLGGTKMEYNGSPSSKAAQRTAFISNSASHGKGGQSNEAISEKSRKQQLQPGQAADNSTQNTQRNIVPLKPPYNGTSNRRPQRNNSKGKQQDGVSLPVRNSGRRSRPRQITIPDPQEYDYTSPTVTSMCNCMTFCPYDTLDMGPCQGVISRLSRQRKRTCCMQSEPLMSYLLPLALLQNLLAEL